MTTAKKQLFISHATKDDALINRIQPLLEKAGYTVWVDHQHGLTPNDADWELALRGAIKTSDAGIFVMTENSLKSRVCKSECLLVQQLGKPLYVIRAENVAFELVWLTISLIQYADWVTDPDKAIADLIQAIGGKTGADLPTATHRFTDAGDMPTHLPYLSNPLRGRDADVVWLRANLDAHITQITGTGGMGKSRLSAEIALNHPQGAVWFRCEAYKTVAELQIALRVHSGLPEGTDIRTIVAHLQTQKPLIVVDNAETVTDTNRPDYVTLLNLLAGNGIPVLLTSRLAWKQFIPRKERPLTFLDSTDGLALARDFVSSEKIPLDDAQLAELAGACKYYPRLMAFSIQQLHEFKPTVILKRLKNLSYDAHEDMQGVLDEMITQTVAQMASEKHGAHADALLRRLTWLTATFPETAIEALKPADMDEDALADALALIRRYQFIRYDSATGRYRLADLVREALGTVDAVFGAYADFYIKRAKEIFVDLEDKPELWGDQEGGENVDDIANIRALGRELLRHTHEGADGDLVRALEFAYVTRRYVQLRMEARVWVWLEMGLRAVQILRQADNTDKALMRRELLLLGELGTVYRALGQTDKSLEYQEQSLPLARALGDKRSEATTLNNIGTVYSVLGDIHKALDYYEQALPMHGQVGNRQMEATTLSNIGEVYSVLGDIHKALDYYEQALLIIREVGDKRNEGGVLNNIAGVYYMLGDIHKAIIYYKYVLPLDRLVGDKRGEALTCFNMGMAYEGLGDLDKAIEYVEYALLLDEQLQSPNAEDDRRQLMRLKQKRGDADVPPESEPTPEEQYQSALKQLIEIYQAIGEDGLRDVLKQNNVPDEIIDNAVADVKQNLG